MSKKGPNDNKVAITIAVISGIAVIGGAIITGFFNLKAVDKQNEPNPTLTATTNPQEVKGYRLFLNGTLIGYEPRWTCQQALDNLSWNMKNLDKGVEGWFDGKKIDFANMGYELFYDCRRLGYEPNWSSQQALDNLSWNIQKYPNNDIKGWFNGEQLKFTP